MNKETYINNGITTNYTFLPQGGRSCFTRLYDALRRLALRRVALRRFALLRFALLRVALLDLALLCFALIYCGSESTWVERHALRVHASNFLIWVLALSFRGRLTEASERRTRVGRVCQERLWWTSETAHNPKLSIEKCVITTSQCFFGRH